MVYKKRIMHTLESVKLYCENLGYELLDDEYKKTLALEKLFKAFMN